MAADHNLPETIGPYKIRSILGSGGMGVVYEAHHPRTGQRVALKALVDLHEMRLYRMRHEIDVLRRLHHPSIVQLLDDGLDDKTPWYAMNLVQGKTLSQHIDAHHLPQASDASAPPRASLPSSLRTSNEGPPSHLKPSSHPHQTLPNLDSQGPWSPNASSSAPWSRPAHTKPPYADQSSGGPWHNKLADQSSGGPWHNKLADQSSGGPWHREPTTHKPLRPPPAHPHDIPAPVQRMLGWMGQMCQALAFLHGEGFVHCDLKPDNIIIDENTHPVLVDFGVVSRFGGRIASHHLEISGLMAGTADYISPEQIRGSLVDARSDLYSLGCILYEVLTGRPPFYGFKSRDLLDQHLQTPPTPPSKLQPWVPQPLDDLIARLLAKKPDARPGHAYAILDVLRQLGIPNLERADAPNPRPYLHKPPMIGRDKPMKSLRAALKRLLDHAQGAALLLAGESGSGKSRLAIELLRYARAHRVRTMTGQCTSVDTTEQLAAAPLHAFAPILRAVADRCLQEGPETTHKILGERASVLLPYAPFLALPGLEDLSPPPPLPPAAARQRIFHALVQTLCAHSEDHPTTLVLDDLQWADELSLGAITELCRLVREERKPWLILGLYRTESLSPSASLQEIQDLFTPIQLERLNPDDLRTLLHQMLGVEETETALVDFVAARSAGNPLYVSELLHNIVEQGLLQRDHAGRWRLVGDRQHLRAQLTRLTSSLSIQELLLQRLDECSPQALQLCRAAAVLGREVDIDILSEISQTSALGGIGELEQRELLEPTADLRLRFRHDKLREALYARLTPQQRAMWHGRAAVALDRLDLAGEPVDPTWLAYHWEQAGQPLRASEAYFKAARNAAATGSLRDARRHFLHGLGLIPPHHPRALPAQLDLIATTLLPLNHLSEARSALERLDPITPQDAPLRARWLLLQGSLLRREDRLALAQETLAQALARAKDQQDPALTRETLVALGTTLLAQGLLPQAHDKLQAALDLASDLRDRPAQSQSATLLAEVAHLQGLDHEALDLYHRALKLARDDDDPASIGWALLGVARVNLDQGHDPWAQQRLDEALACFERGGDPKGHAQARLTLATLRARQGDPEQARALLLELLADPSPSSPPKTPPCAHKPSCSRPRSTSNKASTPKPAAPARRP